MIARVFPRKTSMSPTDDAAFFGPPDLFCRDRFDEVHVSVLFTWDILRAEQLAEDWSTIAPVKIGGPAYKRASGLFVAGRYVKEGCTITSRGCPNDCWFCSVPKREGRKIRELPIVVGHNILDDNLLACSDKHIKSVFQMLRKQGKRAVFSGGLEGKRLRTWHIEELKRIRVENISLAYDTPDDKEPLIEATKLLAAAGFSRHKVKAYVLIGWPADSVLNRLEDTIDEAAKRCEFVKSLGITPFAMLWREGNETKDDEWKKLQKKWCRPAIIWRN
jgi:hypothetical protein